MNLQFNMVARPYMCLEEGLVWETFGTIARKTQGHLFWNPIGATPPAGAERADKNWPLTAEAMTKHDWETIWNRGNNLDFKVLGQKIIGHIFK